MVNGYPWQYFKASGLSLWQKIACGFSCQNRGVA
jgi:hypothetical protein